MLITAQVDQASCEQLDEFDYSFCTNRIIVEVYLRPGNGPCGMMVKLCTRPGAKRLARKSEAEGALQSSSKHLLSLPDSCWRPS